MNTIVTYETQHGSAKKCAEIIAEKLNTKIINIDTPFEAEDLSEAKNIVFVFNFRGPYTAQLTKLFINRMKKQIVNKNVILVGEGLFSEKEFPIVAKEIFKEIPNNTTNTYFIKGQLRTAILTPEEQALLTKFSEITGMEIKDMGELNMEDAKNVASEINKFIETNPIIKEENNDNEEQIKWVCPVCGYVHYGIIPPEKCTLCGAPGEMFKKENQY